MLMEHKHSKIESRPTNVTGSPFVNYQAEPFFGTWLNSLRDLTASHGNSMRPRFSEDFQLFISGRIGLFFASFINLRSENYLRDMIDPFDSLNTIGSRHSSFPDAHARTGILIFAE